VRIEVLDHPLDRPFDQLVAFDRIDVVVLHLDEDASELVDRLIRVLVLGRRLRTVRAEQDPARECSEGGKEDAE
jgi:hypothetical protein